MDRLVPHTPAVQQQQRLWSSRWECAKDSKRTRRPPRRRTFPRTVCRRTRARACVSGARLRARRRLLARGPRHPPPPSPQPRTPPSRPPGTHVARVCASRGHVQAAAGPPTVRQRRGARDSARRPIGAAAAGRRPPAACRSSHTGRRSRATRTPDGRDRLPPLRPSPATERRLV